MRPRWRRVVLYGVLTAAAVAAVCVPASANPAVLKESGSLATFPQGIAPNLGSGLLRVGHGVYYEMVDENGNTTLGRIDPKGVARTATAAGSGYIFSPPTLTSDGGVWFAAELGGAGAAPGDTPNLGVVGLDPTTWQVDAASAPAFTLDAWPSVADRGGRFWTQGNAPGSGIVAIGIGLHSPLVAVPTSLAAASSQSDTSINNPIVLGPDGGVWLLGGDGSTEGLRITSVGPAGIKVDVAPRLVRLGALALTPARGRVWTVGSDLAHRLVAVGVDPTGAITRVPTTLQGECDLDAVLPVYDRHGGLWFTGADASCSPTANLQLADINLIHHTARSHDTGLSVLGDAASTILRTGRDVLVAGLGPAGTLGFARVGRRSDVLQTDLKPWVAPGQARYPLIGDRRKGAWAQAVDADGKLVVVHVTRTKVDTFATGLEPAAREITIGPDNSLWTQGTKDRRLVLVKVTRHGKMTLVPTGEAPTREVLKPVTDGRRHLWFRATEPRTGELVLVRVSV